ncbi:MAG: amidohydrolase [Flavobacteriales bacterium]|nr:amidohydrolase [Flavobacteriales bacterium]
MTIYSSWQFYSYLLLLSIFLSACNYQDTQVDMVVHNAVIYTVDDAFTVAEAMAIDSGRIVAIGPEREIMNKYKGEQMVDAGSRPIYPGFIDSHTHFVEHGLYENQVDLTGTKSWEECVERIQEFASSSPSLWIEGHGWDQNDWEIQQFPAKDALDRLFPDRPVILDRIDKHASLANSKALELALIEGPKRVIGGEIMVDDEGEMTGMLIDKAAYLVKDVIPAPDEDLLKRAMSRAQEDCFEYGITTVAEAGLDTTSIRLIQKMHAEGELLIRIYAMLLADDAGREFMKRGKVLEDRLTVRSVKLYGDGALGSRGAALKHDYHDKEGHRGALLHQPIFFKQWAALCDLYGFQMNTHCIGDRANQIILSVYQDQLKGTNDKRWRIEHAQVVTGNDIAMFGRNNILPSVQPVHAMSDMPWVEERIGAERVDGAYANASLLGENGLVLLGTDFPIEGMDPLQTFYASVFRKNAQGEPEEGWHMEESLTREQALRGMTIWGAIGNFEEEQKGSLEVGKVADFIIMDRDIMQVEESEILDSQVLSTFVHGVKVK